jgi:uncharacterized protein
MKQMTAQVFLVASIIAAASFPGCDRTPAEGLNTVAMRIGDRTFTLEVAADEETRTRGLMFRESMPEDHGMIFVFHDEQLRGFWMKNVEFPLDIIFLDSAGRVVSIRQMHPDQGRRITYSQEPAKYAIELNLGMAERAGVQVGDFLHIPRAAREPVD